MLLLCKEVEWYSAVIFSLNEFNLIFQDEEVNPFSDGIKITTPSYLKTPRFCPWVHKAPVW